MKTLERNDPRKFETVFFSILKLFLSPKNIF